nr:pancreatic triacylglycerol lipase-like [Parasteatoda tepidariorum]
MNIIIIIAFLNFILLQTGFCQVRIDKLSCGSFSRPIHYLFGRADPKLKYMLYTRSNAKDACDLQPTEKAYRMCNFNPKVKTAIIVHSWIPKLEECYPMFDLKDKLLQADDYNVVMLNWTAYSNTHDYTSSRPANYGIAATYSFTVGIKFSSWLHFLQVHGGADANKIHLISHSLGAAVCHFAAKYICNLGRITYLDAAAPLFTSLPEYLQPSNTDADFVESIHTNGAFTAGKGYGYLQPISDIDYYPNGGQMQPKCVYGSKYKSGNGKIYWVKSLSTQISCNHAMSYIYYIASFNKTCKFLGRICDSYEDFTAGKCSSGPVCRMGFYSKKLPNLSAKSKCFLETSDMPPFCLE